MNQGDLDSIRNRYNIFSEDYTPRGNAEGVKALKESNVWLDIVDFLEGQLEMVHLHMEIATSEEHKADKGEAKALRKLLDLPDAMIIEHHAMRPIKTEDTEETEDG